MMRSMTRPSWKTVFFALALALTGLALIGAQAAWASPLVLVPLPPDPAMQALAPEECLFYCAWNGAAKPDPKSKNQTEQLLAEEEIRKFVAAIETELIGLVQKNTQGNPQTQALGQTLPGLVKMLLTRPTAIYVAKAGIGQAGVDVSAGFVVHAGEEKATLAAAVTQLEAPLQAMPGMQPTEFAIGDAKLRKPMMLPAGAPQIAWGFKNDYFLLAIGQGTAEQIVGKLDGKAPAAGWLEKLNQQLPIERRGTMGYINVAGIFAAAGPFMTDPKIGATLDVLGLKQVKSIAWSSGLDGNGMVGKTLVNTLSEPSGLFAVLAGKPLAATDLKPIPKEASYGMALRLDLADIYKRVFEGLGKIDPQARDEALKSVKDLEAQAGFPLLTDLLEPLGDVWRLYSMPQAAPLTAGAPKITGTALVISVRDRPKLEATHQKLLAKAREALAGKAAIKESKYRGSAVYYVKAEPQQTVPVAPAWCLTDDQLVVAIDPNSLKEILARGSSAASLADRPEVSGWFSGDEGPSILVYQDMASALRTAYPALQQALPLAAMGLATQGIQLRLPALPTLQSIERHALPSLFAVQGKAAGVLIERHDSIPYIGSQSIVTTGVAAGLLLPAVQAAREAARRTQSTNNLKQIALSFHVFHEKWQQFPLSAFYNNESKPLLSWRVTLLPYIGEEPLYNEFHLNEPWDSEHNRKLIARMPAVYNNPNLPSAAEGKTNYLLLTGAGGMFDGTTVVKMADVRDGTSYTILAVEAAADKAVVWTKPEDLAFDPNNPFAGLTGFRPGGFLVAFVDGSVRMIATPFNADMFKAFFTRAGGEPIGAGAK